MVENSKISWTHHTFNGWIGCTKVGPGCDHCYAEAQDVRWAAGAHWGTGAPRQRTSPRNWDLPLKWDREAAAAGERRRVFCSSLSDVLDNEVPDEWRADLFSLPSRTPNLDWLYLTKRIGLALHRMPTSWIFSPPPNVWWGATVVDRKEVKRDVPKLLEVPARFRFLSMEPLLESVVIPVGMLRPWECTICGTDAEESGWGPMPRVCPFCSQKNMAALGDVVPIRGIDWIIVGGESGAKARPMHSDWVRSLRDQAKEADVAFHFKQWGQWRRGSDFRPGAKIMLPDGRLLPDNVEALEEANRQSDARGGEMIRWATKEEAGRDLDGRTWDEVPG